MKKELLAYKGPMNIHVRTFFANFLKVIVDDDYKTTNRLFKVYIELTQNTAFYSQERMEVENQSVGVGEFIVNEFENYFNFTTINKILPFHGPKLMNYCEEINRLGVDELRSLKREKRREAGITDVGAHIGLIHVGILSANSIEYSIDDVNDNYSVFSITTKIDKF